MSRDPTGPGAPWLESIVLNFARGVGDHEELPHNWGIQCCWCCVLLDSIQLRKNYYCLRLNFTQTLLRHDNLQDNFLGEQEKLVSSHMVTVRECSYLADKRWALVYAFSVFVGQKAASTPCRVARRRQSSFLALISSLKVGGGTETMSGFRQRWNGGRRVGHDGYGADLDKACRELERVEREADLDADVGSGDMIPRAEDHRMVPGRWAKSGGFPQRFSFFLPSAVPRIRDIVSGILRCSCSFCFFDDSAEDSLGCACLYSNLVAPFLGNPPALFFSLSSQTLRIVVKA